MSTDQSFFHRFFAALDGADPQSAMTLVAPTTWSLRSSGRRTTAPAAASSSVARRNSRAFTVAGDMDGWAHYILHVSREGSTEIALGETRWDDGRHIGTFVAAAEFDHDDRMRRYLVGRSPMLHFSADMTSSQSTNIP